MRNASQDDILADVRARLSLMEGHAAMTEPGLAAALDDAEPPIVKTFPRRSSATIQTAPTQEAAPAMRSHDAQLDDLYASVAAVYTRGGAATGAPVAETRQRSRPIEIAQPLHEARHQPSSIYPDDDDDQASGPEAYQAYDADDDVTEAEPHRFEAVADHPSLDAISQRLASLEEKLESVLVRSAVAAPSDAILDRMDELKGQYQRVAEEIGRLEVIEDNLARLIDEVAGKTTDNALLAESVAERVVSQMSAHGTPVEQASPHSYERLDGIEQLLSSYVTDRQAEDSTTQQLLVSIRTIVETLDTRVGVIEHEIQQATAGEPAMEEAAPAPREHHSAAAASEAEDTSYEIGPEAYASFEEGEPGDEVEAPAEVMPKVASRRAAAPPPAEDEAADERPLSPREQLIASARRAATAAGKPAGAPAKAKAKATPAPAESAVPRVKGGKAEAPKVSNRAARFALDKKSPRPVVILAILALVLACGGLLYGKLTRKPSGPTIKIERKAAPQPDKSEAAPAKTDKQSMIDEPMLDPSDIETGSTAAASVETFDEPAVPATDVALDAPATDETSSISGAVDEDMPPEGIAPLAIRIKAANGDVVAQYQIASQFARGALGAPDIAKAAEWYGRAAKAGHAPSQYQLGALLQRGSGIDQNLAEARSWYAKATSAGHIKAMHNLAVLLTSEEGGPRDYATAAKLFRKAADHGLADSQFNLAILFENGLGVKRSTAEAYRWFSLAAIAGDKEAASRRDGIKRRLAPSIAGRIDAELKSWTPAAIDSTVNTVPSLQAAAGTAETAEAAPAAAEAGPKPADVSLVQDLLKSLGYEVGSPGVLDAKTSEAITSFEQRSKMPPTGQVSEMLIQRLMSLAG
ncbi:MAG: SEL1-like repeat protein [Hyphomicrobiaceae bacterium]